MPEAPTAEAPAEVQTPAPVAGESTASDPNPSPEPGAEALRDAGKQALDRMKAERQAAKAEAQTIRDEFAAFKAKAEGKEKEFAAEQERRNVETAALAKANERILKAEIRAAASGRLANPALALKLLDLSSFEVKDDGDVDADAISSALDDLIKNEPYLAAAQGQQQRFQGKADQGARNTAQRSEEQQLTDALGEATKARDFERAVQIRQRLAALNSAKA